MFLLENYFCLKYNKKYENYNRKIKKTRLFNFY